MKDRVPIPPGHWRAPRGGHFEMTPPRGVGDSGMAHLFPWLFLLLFAALVAVAIIALIRFSKQVPRGGTSLAPASAPPAPNQWPSDPALQDLRARYARGEIDRQEYLQKAADLGDTRPAPPLTPG